MSSPNIPSIIVVGAGIGGLTLACLLEKMGANYIVLEKATSFKPLGSAITLSSQVFLFLDQLGLYKDIERISKPFQDLNIQTLDTDSNEMKHRGSFNSKLTEEESFGYSSRIMARPDLFNILLSRIPREKILLGKRILSIQQNEEGVMVRAQDNTTHHADLLVGADGCYSAVRQSLYKSLESKKLLPKSDQLPLQYDVDCVVGVTAPLDLTEYPVLDTERSIFQVILLKQEPVTIWYMPLSQHRLGWMISSEISKEKKSFTSRFSKTSTEEHNFKHSEWGPDAAMEMCEQYAHLPTPFGTKKLSDLVDKTPKELISKVMLEEKYFETWQFGRTCLLGDACHKILPFGAQGAMQAMLDALILANLLYDIPSRSQDDIRTVLEEYQKQRKTTAKSAVKGSSGAGKLLHSQGIIADMTRDILLNKIPDWMIRKASEKVSFYRPQITWLEFKENIGNAKVIKQEYSPRFLKEQGIEVVGNDGKRRESIRFSTHHAGSVVSNRSNGSQRSTGVGASVV